MALRGGVAGERRKRLVEAAETLCEQGLEVAGEAGDGGGVEQVAPVLDFSQEAPLGAAQDEGQVVPEVRQGAMELLQAAGHVEQRTAVVPPRQAEIAGQALVGVALPRIGIEQRLPHRQQQLPEGGGEVQPVDDDQGVGWTRGARSLQPRRAADHRHRLAGVPRQAELERRQQHGVVEQRLALGDPVQRRDQRRVEAELEARQLARRAGPPRPVERQLRAVGDPCQALRPVAPLFLDLTIEDQEMIAAGARG